MRVTTPRFPFRARFRARARCSRHFRSLPIPRPRPLPLPDDSPPLEVDQRRGWRWRPRHRIGQLSEATRSESARVRTRPRARATTRVSQQHIGRGSGSGRRSGVGRQRGHTNSGWPARPDAPRFHGGSPAQLTFTRGGAMFHGRGPSDRDAHPTPHPGVVPMQKKITRDEALEYHTGKRHGKTGGGRHQALRDPARPVAGLHARRRRAVPGDRASDPGAGLRVHQQGQPGRGGLQRHRGARPGRHRRRSPASR